MSTNALLRLKKILCQFSIVLGYKLNMDKSEVLHFNMGIATMTKIASVTTVRSVKIVKYLTINISASVKQLIDLNYVTFKS